MEQEKLSSEVTDHGKVSPDKSEASKNIEALASQASQVDQGKKLFTPKAPSEKRGPGRPKKIGNQPTDQKTSSEQISSQPLQAQNSVPVITTKDALKPTFEVVSGWLERSLDKRAKLKDEEIDQLSTCYGILLDKWMPTVGEKYAVEFAAVMVTFTVGSRLYAVAADIKHQRLEQMKKERAGVTLESLTQTPPPIVDASQSQPDFKQKETTFAKIPYPRSSQ